MKYGRKISVYLLALMILMISMHFHAGYKQNASSANLPLGQTEYFALQTLQYAAFLQKESTQDIDCRQAQINIPGYIFRNIDTRFNYSCLSTIGKIFIVNIFSYSPCKFLLLLPFHGFS